MVEQNVIIFGSNGMLGSYVKEYFEKTCYNVVCINRNVYDIESNDNEHLLKILKNLTNENDIVINCCGVIPQRNINDKNKIHFKFDIFIQIFKILISSIFVEFKLVILIT